MKKSIKLELEYQLTPSLFIYIDGIYMMPMSDKSDSPNPDEQNFISRFKTHLLGVDTMHFLVQN